MKKSDITSLVVYAIMLVALFCSFYFGSRVLFDNAKIFEGFTSIGVALGVIVGTIVVGSLLLELGHFLGAKIGKYNVVAFNFCGLMFYKTEKGTKFKFKGPDGFMSELQVSPKVGENGKLISKPKAMLWLGNLFLAILVIVGAILYVYYEKNKGTAAISGISLLVAVAAGCLLFYNFLPMELDNKTDGAQLKIVSKPANIEAYNESLRVAACQLRGEDPGEVKLFDDITNYTSQINMVKVYKLLNEEKYEEALKIINMILAAEDKLSDSIKIEMVAQKLYLLLYLNQIDKAKKYYEDILPEDKRFISNSNKLVYIRTYILISAILDPAESEVQYATSKADKAYKKVDAFKKETEAKLYKAAVKRTKELHPTWEPIIKDN